MNNIFDKIFVDGERPMARMFLKSVDDEDCLRTYRVLKEKGMEIYGTQNEFQAMNEKINRIK